MPLPDEDKRKIQKLVIEALESDNSEKRRIAAEARLNHRLRNSFQLAEFFRHLARVVVNRARIPRKFSHLSLIRHI